MWSQTLPQIPRLVHKILSDDAPGRIERALQSLEAAQHIGLARPDAAGQRDPADVAGPSGHGSAATDSESPRADAMRSSMNVFHPWHWGHCQSNSVLRYRHAVQTCGSR